MDMDCDSRRLVHSVLCLSPIARVGFCSCGWCIQGPVEYSSSFYCSRLCLESAPWQDPDSVQPFEDRCGSVDNIGIVSFVLAECGIIVHLLFSCTFAWNLWMASYNWLSFSTVIPNNGKAHSLQHVFSCWSKKQEKETWMIWLSVIWTIWNSRNNCIFREDVTEIDKILYLIQFKFWSWMREKLKGFNFSFYDWQAQHKLFLALLWCFTVWLPHCLASAAQQGAMAALCWCLANSVGPNLIMHLFILLIKINII